MDFVTYPCFSITGVRFDNRARSVNKKAISDYFKIAFDPMDDLVVGMVTCCRVPGLPTFLANVEKVGVAWDKAKISMPKVSKLE